MRDCKVCGERLDLNEKAKGICNDCELAVSKLIIKKAGKGFYPRKVRLKV